MRAILLGVSLAFFHLVSSLREERGRSASGIVFGVTEYGSELESLFNWTKDRLTSGRGCNVSELDLEIIDSSDGIHATLHEVLSSIYTDFADNETEPLDSSSVILLYTNHLNSDLYDRLRPVLPSTLPILRVNISSIAPAIRASLGLMSKLSWEKASAFTPFQEISSEFLEISRDEGLCINKIETRSFESGDSLYEGEFSDSIAILEDEDSILEIPPESQNEWIVYPLGGTQNISSQIVGEGIQNCRIFVIEKSYLEVPELMRSLNLAIESPFAPSILEALLHLFQPACETHSRAFKSEDLYASLGIRSQKPKFYIYQLLRDGTLKILGEFRKERVFPYPNATGIFAPRPLRYGVQPRCLNLDAITATPSLNWRFETWLTSILTISCMGIVSCGCIGVFIACKSCSIMIEGSQYLSLFLLLCLMFNFGSLFLFGLHPSELVCQSRAFAVGSVYSLTFGTLLGRSFMLATGDFEGLPGHVSGVITFVLIFFIFAVQIGLMLQELILRREPYTETRNSGRLRFTECRDKGRLFIRYLLYPAFLLLIQIVLAPFIVHSKRNYKEGFLFVLASVAIAISWISWITGYLLLPGSLGSDWYDMSLCFGLISLPTLILALIYIPKLYYMSCPPYKVPPPLDTPLGVNLTRTRAVNDSFGTSPLQDGGSLGSGSSRDQLRGASGLSRGLSNSQACVSSEYGNNVERISGEESVDQCNSATSFIGSNSKINSDYTAAASAAAIKAAQKYGEQSHNPHRQVVEYPTFKLDKNSVIDPRWQRYSFTNTESSSPESKKIPAPPPIPPLRNTSNG